VLESENERKAFPPSFLLDKGGLDQNGQDSSTAEYTALDLNPVVDPKLFEKRQKNRRPNRSAAIQAAGSPD
jgi:hypothetical protein